MTGTRPRPGVGTGATGNGLDGQDQGIAPLTSVNGRVSDLDLDAVREALAPYRGAAGLISVVSVPDNWSGREFPTSLAGLEQAVQYVCDLDAQGAEGIYLRGTTVRAITAGRGGADDSMVWLRFQLDLDYGKAGYAPDAETVLRVVKGAGLPEPSAFVSSGHGVYPQWELAPAVPDSLDVRALAADIAAELCRAFAAEGFELDKSIGADAARVWRIPGTVNRKREPFVPCRVLETSERAYSLAELRAAVPASAAAPPGSGNGRLKRPARRFTREQGREYVEHQALAPLRAAPDGTINTTLNSAAVVIGHFVPAFCDEATARESLHQALTATVYDGRTWQAEATITSGLAKGMREPYRLVEDAPAAGGEQGKRLRLVRGSEVTPKIARWLWKDDQGFGRIPLGEVSVAAGRGNVGKSPFALWLAARLTHGELSGQLYGTPVDVLIYASEDSHAHTTVPRLIAAGADMDRVHLICGTATDADPDIPLDWAGDLPLIQDAVIEKRAGLVVIDPLFDVYRSGSDTNKTDDVRHGLRPLVAMAHMTGTSVLGLAHFNKQRTGDIALLLSGSHALRDVVRAVIVFAVDADGVRMLGQDKNNLGRSGSDVPVLTYDMASVEVEIENQLISQPVFTITGTTDVTMGDVLSGGAGTQAGELPRDLEWLFDLIAARHPRPLAARKCAEVAEERGLRWDTVSRKARRTHLFEHWQERGAVARWVWGLSDEGRRRAGKTPKPGPTSQSVPDPL